MHGTVEYMPGICVGAIEMSVMFELLSHSLGISSVAHKTVFHLLLVNMKY